MSLFLYWLCILLVSIVGLLIMMLAYSMVNVFFGESVSDNGIVAFVAGGACGFFIIYTISLFSLQRGYGAYGLTWFSGFGA